MVRAGELRYVVVIEQRSSVQDTSGEPEDVWQLVVIRRASKKKTPGSEVWSSDQRSARVPTLFRLRFIDESEAVILPEMRLTCDGKLYDIVSAIDPDGMRSELVITAVERVEESP